MATTEQARGGEHTVRKGEERLRTKGKECDTMTRDKEEKIKNFQKWKLF